MKRQEEKEQSSTRQEEEIMFDRYTEERLEEKLSKQCNKEKQMQQEKGELTCNTRRSQEMV